MSNQASEEFIKKESTIDSKLRAIVMGLSQSASNQVEAERVTILAEWLRCALDEASVGHRVHDIKAGFYARERAEARAKNMADRVARLKLENEALLKAIESIGSEMKKKDIEHDIEIEGDGLSDDSIERIKKAMMNEERTSKEVVSMA